MSGNAEHWFAADTPHGALLRAAVAGLALAGLLLVVLRPAGEDAEPPASTPPVAASSSTFASDDASPSVRDVITMLPAPVPADGAPSGEVIAESTPDVMTSDATTSDAVEAPAERESGTAALTADDPRVPGPDTASVPAEPRAAADRPATALSRPDSRNERLAPPLKELKPQPPAVKVPEGRVLAVIPQGAEPLPVQPRSQPRPTAPTPATDRFAIQLGGFLAIDEARALQAAAGDAGYPTRMLHRVLLGPYGSRANASAAQRGTRGILIGADNEWWVQLGVFAEAANAEGLHAKMAAEGRPGVLQGRVELGPYAGRGSAEQVLGALREALGQPLPDASIFSR